MFLGKHPLFPKPAKYLFCQVLIKFLAMFNLSLAQAITSGIVIR